MKKAKGKQPPDPFFEKIKRMKQSKLSENTCSSLEVDIKLEHNILSQNTTSTKCTVVSLQVNESTEFFVFRTKQLIFTVETKVKTEDASWSVRRQEQDFYTLRSILVITFG